MISLAMDAQSSSLWKLLKNATISAIHLQETGAEDEILFGFRED
jgi:hypothetical protein